MTTTIKAVNVALKNAGHDGELVRGNGYFYFWGGEASGWYSSSVPTMQLQSRTPAEWVATYEQLKADDAARR